MSQRLRTAAAITWHPQTELALNTHAAVSEILTVVSGIRSTIEHGQEVNDGKLPVSDIRTPDITERPLITPQAQARSAIQPLIEPLSYISTQRTRRISTSATENVLWTRCVNQEDS